MATNTYNQNYKYTYSKEVDLLDTLIFKIEESANNLDINSIERLMNDFKSENYSSLRPSNQQYFDELVSYVNVLITNIKKRKALAEQIEKNRQIIENSYKRLQEIKKNISNAKTISELDKAKKQYEKWKSQSSKIKFGWSYNKKVDTIKNYILEKIGPEDAITELKELLERAKHSDGFENDNDIKAWTSKYPLACFHEVYKKDVNNLTSEAYSLVREPILNEDTLSTSSIVDSISTTLSISPTQSYAVNDLQKIMNTNAKDFNSILQWIYIYRNITFDGPYKQAISTLIPKFYGLNLNSKYSIPTIEIDNLNSKEINNLVKDTVINYFGILLCGNDLSSSKKAIITGTYKHSQENTLLAEISEDEKTTDKLLENGATPTFKNNNLTEIEVEISSILPEIEFEEQKFEIATTKKPTTFSNVEEPEQVQKFYTVNKESSKIEETPCENKESFQFEEISSVDKEPSQAEKIPAKLKEPHKDLDENNSSINSQNLTNPYSLTTEDIQNIESIYYFIQPKIKKASIEHPEIERTPIEHSASIEEPIDYISQKTIDIDNQN